MKGLFRLPHLFVSCAFLKRLAVNMRETWHPSKDYLEVLLSTTWHIPTASGDASFLRTGLKCCLRFRGVG